MNLLKTRNLYNAKGAYNRQGLYVGKVTWKLGNVLAAGLSVLTYVELQENEMRVIKASFYLIGFTMTVNCIF